MFWKPSNPREKELSGKMEKAKKQSNNQAKFILDLCDFTPEYNNIICKKLAPKLVEFLKEPVNQNDVASATVELIKTMIEKSEILINEMTQGSRSINQTAEKAVDQKIDPKTPDFVPFSHFLKQSNFLNYIFAQSGFNDERILYIIEKFYAFEPLNFVKWILAMKQIEKSPLMNLYQMVAKTQNLRGGRIIHLLTVGNDDIKQKLTQIVKPFLRKFPVSIVIDLMVASNEIKEVIPSAEFERWLLNHDEFTLSDIEIVTNFYKKIWLSETSLKLLLKSVPPEKMSDTRWMIRREPQDFEVSREVINLACRALTPRFPIKKAVDCSSNREPYLFVRIFIVSLINPEKMTIDARKTIVNLLKDPDEHVKAAATQCLVYWVLKFNYKIDKTVVYRIAAAAVEDNISDALRILYKCALHVFGTQYDVATTILQSEEKMRFLQQNKTELFKSTWLFPHFKVILNDIFALKLIDYNQVVDLVSFISTYLCIGIDSDKMGNEDVHAIADGNQTQVQV